MEIKVLNSSVELMANWLLDCKNKHIKDEKKLREILAFYDYGIEFERYGLKDLPLCNISFEEAVDFFLNFEDKIFDNERLVIKQDSFKKFYSKLEENMDNYYHRFNLGSLEIEEVQELLIAGLPNEVVQKIGNFNILFTISIGNSFGWPYKNYIHFDVANFAYINNKEDFVHLLAHEIYHTLYDYLMPDNYSSQDYFLLNFGFEGLAIHFMNNGKTKYKEAKYLGRDYVIDKNTWSLFDSDFAVLIKEFKNDYYQAKYLSLEETEKLITKYTQSTYLDSKGVSHQVLHYATYYLGCYFFGLIDNAFGKDVLFKGMKEPATLITLYNKAIDKLVKKKELIFNY